MPWGVFRIIFPLFNLLLIANIATAPSANAHFHSQITKPQTTFYQQGLYDSQNLLDKNWIEDPANYMKTTTIIINQSVLVPILEYHEANYVPGDLATLKPGQFLSEIQWLHAHDFHTINLGQLYGAIYHGYNLPPRSIVLSFDDGYESIYFRVFPILKEYHDQATLFIVSHFIHDKPNRTVKFPTLTTSELQEMQASGLVDVESHTIYHRNLDTLNDAQAQWEIKGSAIRLQELVHHPIDFFCYPDGRYTDKTISFVQAAGYLLAVSQHQGYANIKQGAFTLNRITILDTTSLHEFAKILSPSRPQILSDPIQTIYQRGANAFSKRDYASAIRLENEVIREDASFYQAYNIKGIAQCFAGDYQGGLASINESLDYHPNYGYARFNKALALELYAHYDEAIQAYHLALQLKSRDWWVPWCYYGIASIYGRRGDVANTVKFLEQAIHINPEIKVSARSEKDFNNVKNSTAFQAITR